MKRHASKLFLASLVLFVGAAWPPPSAAESPIQCKGEGRITFGDDGSAVVLISGTASHLGKYLSYEEVVFGPGNEDGELYGAGVVAFLTANGDVLVGVSTWHVYDDWTAEVTLAWRDSVTFADGTTAASTGRFAGTRPPGAANSCTTNALGQLICDPKLTARPTRPTD